jgi:hypothetical protein
MALAPAVNKLQNNLCRLSNLGGTGMEKVTQGYTLAIGLLHPKTEDVSSNEIDKV